MAEPRAASPLWCETVDASAFATLRREWESLAARAAVPNAFMDPAAALAMARSSARSVRVFLAWRGGGRRDEGGLVGAWVLRDDAPPLTWPLRALSSPVESCYLNAPVVDASCPRQAIAALLRAIRAAGRGTPGLVKASYVPEGLAGEMAAAAAGLGMSVSVTASLDRPCLRGGHDPFGYWASSASPRKLGKVARLRRQLAVAGDLRHVVATGPDVPDAMVEFMGLEASGWKGAAGSALASRAETSVMARHMVEGLAAQGLASVHSLRLDGRPIAMMVVLRSAGAALTWRSAYDETRRHHAPGMLLLEDMTASFLSDPTLGVVDSCNVVPGGTQAERWSERTRVVDLLVGVGPGTSFLVRALAARLSLARRLRRLASGIAARFESAGAGDAAQGPKARASASTSSI